MKVDLIVHNIGQLVTCTSGARPKRGPEMYEVGIIENAAVAIKDGVFKEIGRSDEVLGNNTANELIDAGGRAAVPGFVDPHTHIIYAGDRLNEFELKIKGAEYLDILAAGGGIISTVRNTRDASEEELVETALGRLDKMLDCGTTVCEIKTGYGLNAQTELKMLRVIEAMDKRHSIKIVPTFLAAHAIPPEFNNDSEGYVTLICGEMLPRAWEWYSSSHFSSGNTPFFVDIYCERNAFNLEHTKRIFETADKLGFQLKAHVDQFTNLGGSQLGVENNAVSIDHLDAISDEEIAMLAASHTIGVVIPTENFNSGKTKFTPAKKMVDAGCTIALTTDYNPGSAPCPSQSMAMAIACRYQKLMPAEALNAATINAAYAIGLGELCGSVEIGKRADLNIIDAQDWRMLAYEFGGDMIAETIVNGWPSCRDKEKPVQ